MSATSWRVLLFVGGSAVMCSVAYNIMKSRDMMSRFRKKWELAVNEVLFYGSRDDNHNHKIGLDNILCINYVIQHATSSVDVCIPSLASDTISNSLMDLQTKNQAKIRVIIHRKVDEDQVSRLMTSGVQVKVVSETLEHEFILVDAAEGPEEAVALVGSLDYEVTRVNCNRDSTLLSSEAVLVSSLKREFDRIWNSTGIDEYIIQD